MTLRITDHALLRFLERAGGLDVEALRASIAASLERSVTMADRLRQAEISIRADGLVYIVRDGTLVTVLRATPRG